MKYAYGYVNAVYYNIDPSGDEDWFTSRSARDAALAGVREEAVTAGLSESSAKHGIYPVRRHVASAVGEEWAREVGIEGF